MPKNIVICSDGTGNTAIKARGTNVFKLYEAVDIQGHKYDQTLKPQVAFYDDGVGTSRLTPLKLIGGAFGFGFRKNVKDLYTELAHVYEPGDHIYLFGFSRGAYTVRALSGMIEYCGILDIKKVGYESLKKRVHQCWTAFRQEAFQRVLDGNRRCPRDIDVLRFLAGVMRSIASDWCKARRRWQRVQLVAPAAMLEALMRRNLLAAVVAGLCGVVLPLSAAAQGRVSQRFETEQINGREAVTREFNRLELLGHQMSGSGTSYFGICRNAQETQHTAARLRARRLGNVYAVRGCA